MSERAARQCGGKRRYPSERRAAVAAQKTQRIVAVPMRPYACPFCKGWHFGSVEVHERPERELPRRERYKTEGV